MAPVIAFRGSKRGRVGSRHESILGLFCYNVMLRLGEWYRRQWYEDPAFLLSRLGVNND